MNKKAIVCASVVAVLCAAAMLTLITWPLTDSITWKPLTQPAWWQFEWLHALGFWLSALPSFVIYAFDPFFAANESLRDPAASLLVAVEIFLLCFGTYKFVAAVRAQQAVQPDRREDAAPG
jgi:hypothetical protein